MIFLRKPVILAIACILIIDGFLIFLAQRQDLPVAASLLYMLLINVGLLTAFWLVIKLNQWKRVALRQLAKTDRQDILEHYFDGQLPKNPKLYNYALRYAEEGLMQLKYTKYDGIYMMLCVMLVTLGLRFFIRNEHHLQPIYPGLRLLDIAYAASLGGSHTLWRWRERTNAQAILAQLKNK